MLLLLAAGGLAAAGLDENAEFLAAQRALAEGIGGVAALKAERLIDGKTKWSAVERGRLAALAAEGWLRAGQPARTLALADRLEIPDEPFWRGVALLRLDRVEEAEKVLRSCPENSPWIERARMALAQALLAQGREAQARKIVQGLRSSGDPQLARQARLFFNEMEMEVDRFQIVAERLAKEKPGQTPGVLEFLRARAYLEQDYLPEAQQQLAAVLKTSAGGTRLHHAATVMLAEAMIRAGKPADATRLLVQFLDKAAASDFSYEAFDALARARDAEQGRSGPLPLPPSVLEWISDGATPWRQGYALFLAGRWLARQDRKLEAAGVLEALLAIAPRHRKESDTMRLLMETYGALGADTRVLALSQAWKESYGGGASSEVDFVTGKILFSRGDFAEALDLFQHAADLASSVAERRRAIYNAAICAIRAGETALYQTLLARLDTNDPQAKDEPKANTSAPSGADLELTRALDLAARGEAEAGQALAQFVQNHPEHPRLAEARIAIAELALLDVPPRVKAAEEALDQAEANPPPGGLPEAQQQRIAYTRLWVREAQPDLVGVTKAGLEFLSKWPQAPLSAEVRMKTAEAFFRQEDMANARTQFEIVAREYPGSPFADTALFFAGRAAMIIGGPESLNDAIEIWEQLADQGGPLALEARHQQAVAKRREGHEEDAIKVLDTLLIDPKVDAEMRRSLTCEKAELLQLLGARDKARLEEAVILLDKLAAEKDLPFAWQARVAHERGNTLRALGKPVEALESCHAIVEAANYEHPGTPVEFLWFYKAGFLAVDLLLEGKQWEAAARVAERLSQTAGDRATEAKDLATKIRLDHYLWDDTK